MAGEDIEMTIKEDDPKVEKFISLFELFERGELKDEQGNKITDEDDAIIYIDKKVG